jgi:hypothetical protein
MVCSIFSYVGTRLHTLANALIQAPRFIPHRQRRQLRFDSVVLSVPTPSDDFVSDCDSILVVRRASAPQP